MAATQKIEIKVMQGRKRLLLKGEIVRNQFDEKDTAEILFKLENLFNNGAPKYRAHLKAD